MTVSWSKGKDYLVYAYQDGANKRLYRDDAIVHFRGPSEDGVLGKGPIQEARDVVGNALALDQFQSYFYANGVRSSGILEHPSTLTDETAKRIAESFKGAYAGAANSGKVIVLEEGMKFTAVSMSPKDAEFLQVRKFTITEIARIFRVPPHMIGDLEKSSFSNIEQEAISFVVHSIRPWTVRIEQALMKTLLAGQEEDYFVEFLLDALLRGDVKSRYEAYQIGLQNGFLKLNDVREKENMNPLDWGDVSMIPLNMKVISSIEDLNSESAPSEDAPAEDSPDEEDVPAEDAPDEEDVEEEENKSFSYQVESLTQSFEPLFEKAFATIAKRELTLSEQKYESVPDFDGKVRKVLGTHQSFVRSQLEPVVVAFASQLSCLGGVYLKRSTPLRSSFVADYVNRYTGKRFDEIWALSGEAEAISAWGEGLKRTLRQSEVADVTAKVRAAIFTKEENNHESTDGTSTDSAQP
jgi:HK97 family phage portal protein